jgi:hypothetical protein
MPDGLGPCYTCPGAMGILLTPTGLHRVCGPEQWRCCEVTFRTSMPIPRDGWVHRALHHHPIRTLRSSFTYLLNRVNPVSGSSTGSDE